MPWRVRLSDELAVTACALLAGNRQQRLGVGTSNGQQRARSTTWLLATMFPALQCAHRHAQQRRELALGQASLLTRFRGWAVGRLAYLDLIPFPARDEAVQEA